MNRCGRHPGAFVVAGGDLAIWAYPNAIGRPKALCINVQGASILAHFEKATRVGADRSIALSRFLVAESASAGIHGIGFVEVDVSLSFRLQLEDELMKPFGGHELVVEVLIIIRFAIPVQVVVTG